MGWHMYGWGFWIFMILIVIAIVVVFNRNDTNKKSPKDILDERLARGEITKEEYEEILKRIKG